MTLRFTRSRRRFVRRQTGPVLSVAVYVSAAGDGYAPGPTPSSWGGTCPWVADWLAPPLPAWPLCDALSRPPWWWDRRGDERRGPAGDQYRTGPDDPGRVPA